MNMYTLKKLISNIFCQKCVSSQTNIYTLKKVKGSKNRIILKCVLAKINIYTLKNKKVPQNFIIVKHAPSKVKM